MAVTLVSRLDPWVPPLLLMGLIFFLSAQPDLDSGLGAIDLIGRKLIHAGEYGLLCLLWFRALATRASAPRASLIAFLVSVAYAATDEYHQTFVAGRSGSVIDVAVDALGAGAVALALRRRSLPRKAVS
jgi:VanZ family protein